MSTAVAEAAAAAAVASDARDEAAAAAAKKEAVGSPPSSSLLDHPLPSSPSAAGDHHHAAHHGGGHYPVKDHRNIKIEPPLAYRGEMGAYSSLLQDASQDYLHELLWDKSELRTAPAAFRHVTRLIDKEINTVLSKISAPYSYHDDAPAGDRVTLQEKIYVPVEKYPRYNFVGRILGPRGMTAKQLEEETGCKIMVRGRGSCRSEPLHVLITCEDTADKVEAKMKRAVDRMNELLSPPPEGKDELKRKQLIELSIINGTYRPTTATKLALQAPRLPSSSFTGLHHHHQSSVGGGGGGSSPVFDHALMGLLSENKRRGFSPSPSLHHASSSSHHHALSSSSHGLGGLGGLGSGGGHGSGHFSSSSHLLGHGHDSLLGGAPTPPPASPLPHQQHNTGHHLGQSSAADDQATAALIKNARAMLEQQQLASALGAAFPGLLPAPPPPTSTPAWPFPFSQLDYYVHLLTAMSSLPDPSLLTSLLGPTSPAAAPAPPSAAADLFSSLSLASPSGGAPASPTAVSSAAFPFGSGGGGAQQQQPTPAAIAAAAATGSSVVQPANWQQCLAAAAMLSNVPYASSPTAAAAAAAPMSAAPAPPSPAASVGATATSTSAASHPQTPGRERSATFSFGHNGSGDAQTNQQQSLSGGGNGGAPGGGAAKRT